MRGKIITIEGTDGAGKNTQAKILTESLNYFGIPTKMLSFPQYGTSHAKQVEDYLQGKYGEVGSLSSLQVSTLYAFDRSVSMKENNVEENLKNGVWYVIDRFTESNIIYQTANIDDINEKRRISNEIRILENILLDIPMSSLVLYLNVPTEYSTKLVEKRGNKKDIHEKNIEFLKKVENNLPYLVDFPCAESWNIINCVKDNEMRKVSDISNEIFYVVSSNFELKNYIQ